MCSVFGYACATMGVLYRSLGQTMYSSIKELLNRCILETPFVSRVRVLMLEALHVSIGLAIICFLRSGLGIARALQYVVTSTGTAVRRVGVGQPFGSRLCAYTNCST